MTKFNHSDKIPDPMKGKFDEIAALIDSACDAHLSAEYKQYGRHMLAALCRKRPSPLNSGRPETWAAGVLCALGRINFLGDKSTKPHMRIVDLCAVFGVGESTGSAKGSSILKALKANHFSSEWVLPSRVEANPMIWFLSVNGYLMDIRHAPRGAQEEAFRCGLIPYIPADRTPS